MRKAKASLILAALASSVTVSAQVNSALQTAEKTLAFPSPVEWRLNSEDVSVSLIGLAWGPADSPEMMAKAREPHPNEKPTSFSDRPYVIALHFQARTPRLVEMFAPSGLVRIKDLAGDMEGPWDLTSSGLVQARYDIHFSRANTTQYWDFFPASPHQREFLFEVHSVPGSNPILSFRVIAKDGDLVVVNTTPNRESACLQFAKNFGGTIGADSLVTLHLTRQGTTLSGTEQYTRIGRILWLTGNVDSLGNFMIEERYPKNHATGILKGRFDAGYQTMSGHFSKPDGSRLQPFEFHEVQPTSVTQQQAPSPQCE